MVSDGRPFITGPTTVVEFQAEKAEVTEMTNHLLRAFNRYLGTHTHVGFPEALLTCVSVLHTVVSDQADTMGLSPEQRQSYYETVMATVNRALTGEIEKLMTVPPRRKGDQP